MATAIKYKLKLSDVDAIELTAEMLAGTEVLPAGVSISPVGPDSRHFEVATSVGPRPADAGDWLIVDAIGQMFVVPRWLFTLQYERK